MKTILLLLSAMLLAQISYSQRASVISIGLVGGVFNNGAYHDAAFAEKTGESYKPGSSKFVGGITIPIHIYDYIRIETSLTRTKVSNSMTRTVAGPEQNVFLQYGNTNYQFTVAPALQLNMDEFHPYLGAELGWSLPDGDIKDGGSIVGGKVGFDLDVTKSMFLSCGLSVGKMTHPYLDIDDKNSFSYYKLLIGVNYKLPLPQFIRIPSDPYGEYY